MFAVIENKQNKKLIIGFINRPQEFLEFVKKEINDDNYIYLTNVLLDEISNEKIFKNNKYLIHYIDDNKLIYVEKTINIEHGFFYNSHKVDLNILCKWKLIQNKVDMDRDYYRTLLN